MDYTFDFKNKSVVITGGASGIGLECAKGFLQKGAAVYIADYSTDNLVSAERELKGQFPDGKIFFLHCDITRKEEREKIISAVKKNTGSADILVNNAGVARSVYSINETEEGWGGCLTSILRHSFLCARNLQANFSFLRKRGR